MTHTFAEEEFTTRFNGRVVLRMLKLARPYWHWVVGFVLMIAATSVLDSYFTLLNKRLIDEAVVPGDVGLLRRLLMQYGGLAIVQAIGGFGFIYFVGVLGERLAFDLRSKLFTHLQELSFSYFDQTPVGWIMSRVTSDSGRIADLVTWGLLDVTWAVLNIGTSFFFISPSEPHCHGVGSGDGCGRILVPSQDPRAISRCAKTQLRDHRRIQ